MLKWIARLLAAGMVVLSGISGFCDYYRYRDENGVLRFTDDLSRVPSDQRPKVTAYRSVENGPVVKQDSAANEKNKPHPQGSTNSEALPAGNAWEEKKARKMAAFDRKQAELDRTFQALQNERAKLMNDAPSENASFGEKAIFNRKVKALNTKIGRYEKELAAFNRQVEDYNAQVKNK